MPRLVHTRLAHLLGHTLSSCCLPACRCCLCIQTLDYDGKIEGMEDDDDALVHYRLVRLAAARACVCVTWGAGACGACGPPSSQATVHLQPLMRVPEHTALTSIPCGVCPGTFVAGKCSVELTCMGAGPATQPCCCCCSVQRVRGRGQDQPANVRLLHSVAGLLNDRCKERLCASLHVVASAFPVTPTLRYTTDSGSCMGRGKLSHEVCKLLHALKWHAVVDGGAHAAHAPVALELDLRREKRARSSTWRIPAAGRPAGAVTCGTRPSPCHALLLG